ncbi:MAG: VgrG-related protein [Chloroflexota bacterium]
MPKTEKHISQLMIWVNNNDLPPEVIRNLDDALVEEDLQRAMMFTLRFNDPTLELLDSELLSLGSEVRISAGGPGKPLQLLMIGEITALEPVLEQHNVRLVVRGYDRSHRLRRGTRTRTFVRQSDADIAAQIAREAGLGADIEPTSEQYDYVVQDNQTDWAFLQSRAARIGYRVSVDDRTLRFRRAEASPPKAPEQAWGDSLITFRARLSVAAQPNEVQVRGWDPAAKQAILGRATRPSQKLDVNDERSPGAAATQAFSGQATVAIGDRLVRSQSEAEQVAQAVLDEISSDYVTAEGVCWGDAGIRAGRLIPLRGIGKRMGGSYFITATRHEYTPRDGYMTTFYATGRRSSDLLVALEREPSRRQFPGVVVGVVTNVSDPERLGRVKVMFPWLDTSHESDWTRLALPGAGKERGVFAAPQVGDEVLLAFEHGNLDRGYVLGALWNGKDQPPADAVAEGRDLTLIRTGGGRVIAVDDQRQQITIASGRHTITLSDTGNRLTVESGGDLELQAPGGKLSITSSGVQLTSNGSLAIEANAMLDVKTSAVLNIKGSLVNINS